MALDTLLSILKQIWELGLNVKAALEKAGHNAEGCRRIGELLRRLDAIAKRLQGTPEVMGDSLMRDAAEGLEDALRRASELVTKCKDKSLLRRAWEAEDIADKLREVCLDVLLNLGAVLLANGVYTAAEIAQLRADVASTKAMLAKLLQIVVARPDVHLPKEVAELVQAYRDSTEYASSQIKNKRETKKTDVASSQKKNKRETKETDAASSQNKNKRETKKTDLARPEVKIQKNNRVGDSKAPHASLSDGPASVESVVRQSGSSTIINKASSSISKLVDEVQSVAVSAAPFQLQQIIGVSEVPGETASYKIRSRSSKTSKLLDIYPLKLRFPFEPKKETIQCPVTLTNQTDHYVGVWIKPTNERFTRTEIMEPHSTLVVSVTLKMHEQPPKDMAKFAVLMIVVQSKDDHVKLESSIGGKLNIDSGFMACVEKLQAKVYRAMMTAITCEPASCQIIPRSTKNMTLVTSIDAHPTKTWIVTGHKGGSFSIWDYQKQKTVMELQVNEVPGKAASFIHKYSQYIKETAASHSVCSVKFIAEKKWLVVGDGNGYIYVYGYTDTKLYEVKKFRAHHKSIDSLAVHPTEPYLLSSSAFGSKIKLWDWSRNWKKIQEFDVKPTSTYEDGVRSVKFNPRDTNTFACVTFDNRVKVGNIKSSSLTTKLKGPFNADYFFTRSHQHLMVTLGFNSHNSKIRDLETGNAVHTLGVSGCKMSRVACHPTLPILVTMLDDGTICLWDASTYRLEEMVHITECKSCDDLVFVIDTNGLTRLIVTFETKIAIMEVNLPNANTSKWTGTGNYG